MLHYKRILMQYSSKRKWYSYLQKAKINRRVQKSKLEVPGGEGGVLGRRRIAIRSM